MSSLREMQMCTDSWPLEGATAPELPRMSSEPIDALTKLRTYRNNLLEGSTSVLRSAYPVVERLVGQACFRQIAVEFLLNHASRCGHQTHIGESFPPVLRRWFADGGNDYLADLAALEWAHHQSRTAPAAPPFDFAKLGDVPPNAYAQLRFRLAPACRLFRSAFPVIRIWSANQPDVRCEETIDLASGSDLVLIHRSTLGVELRGLDAADFALLEAFSQGVRLGDALEAAVAVDPAFNLSEALSAFVILGVLVGADTLPA